MLKTQEEIRLLEKAMEPGIRNPNRRADQFPRIIRRFLSSAKLNGATVVDMGPGHFDFADAIRAEGAKVIGVELDPPVAELGRLRGHHVIEADLRLILLDELIGSSVDGVFCNGSINAYWFYGKPKEHVKYIEHIDRSLKPGGWAWIAPWNNPTDDERGSVRPTLDLQRETFARLGYKEVLLNRYQIDRYHVSTVTSEKLLFTKGLNYGPWPW